MLTSRRDILKWFLGGPVYLASASHLPACTSSLASRDLSTTVRITADARRVIGHCDPALWANIGFDPMYYHTVTPETQPVWDMIHESRAFRYIRCHNTFSDADPHGNPDQIWGCRVYSENPDGMPHYNFRYLDEVLDTWIGAGLKPILEMDFMPDALARGTIKRNYSGGAINVPKDLARWRELVYQTVKHLVERYGVHEVRTWYFEAWNEPDVSDYFIDGTTQDGMAQFLRMYDYFVDGVINVDSLLKVGGPGLAGHNDFFQLFLEHLIQGTNAVTGQRGTRADFVSWHAYGTSDEILKIMRQRRAMVRKYPELANVALHQNEWGQALIPGVGATIPSVLNEYEAAFLCRTIDNILNNESSQIDLFLRWGDLLNWWRPLAWQYGDLALPLPIFYTYCLLAKLGPQRISVETLQGKSTIGAFGARHSIRAVQIVVYRLEEYPLASVAKEMDIELTVTGISHSTLSLKIYRIDGRHGNAYQAWRELGNPQFVTRKQAEAIAEKSRLVPESRTIVGQGGMATVPLSFPPNSMAFITVEAG